MLRRAGPVQDSEFCWGYPPPTSGCAVVRRQIQVSSLFCHLGLSQSSAGVWRVRDGKLAELPAEGSSRRAGEEPDEALEVPQDDTTE